MQPSPPRIETTEKSMRKRFRLRTWLANPATTLICSRFKQEVRLATNFAARVSGQQRPTTAALFCSQLLLTPTPGTDMPTCVPGTSIRQSTFCPLYTALARGGCTHVRHSRSLKTMDPRISAMPGRSNAGTEHVGCSPDQAYIACAECEAP